MPPKLRIVSFMIVAAYRQTPQGRLGSLLHSFLTVEN